MVTKKNLYIVIMAGGRGERFWPVSRVSRPKQFVSIFGGKPLIKIAVERLDGLVEPEQILVITSDDLVELSRETLPMLPAENIIGEPFGRDTAAACALGMAWVAGRGGDSATMAVLTADHLIEDVPVFLQTLADASDIAAREDTIGTIGIVPEYPATGYGYIEAGEQLESDSKTEFIRIKRFVEKPDLETAKEYVSAGNYYWNSGMFIWSVKTFKDALREFCPQLFEMTERMKDKFGGTDFAAILLEEYSKLDRISIDYAVMEKAKNIVAARGAFGWDDVGTWVSAGEHLKCDDAGNALHGKSEVLKATGNTIVNDVDGHLVAVMGADDLVVVHTADATLVCTKESAQDLKEIVKQISDNNKNISFT
ncbi:MAG: NTP transferase domain-containing protein [Lentisphaerae bacterium]|jgi:mannose-1-phosphate guanylyltransferase|nr:NTP transferase domain-containing protein [Lentisphaerota bacterium]